MSALSDLERFVADVCARAGVAREPRLRLSLLMEELFTNTVEHGYGRDTDEAVLVAIEASPDRIRVIYEDTAPPHDPFSAPRPPADVSPRADAKAGGIGLRLVAGMSTPAYEYTADGRNRISLLIEAP